MNGLAEGGAQIGVSACQKHVFSDFYLKIDEIAEEHLLIDRPGAAIHRFAA